LPEQNPQYFAARVRPRQWYQPYGAEPGVLGQAPFLKKAVRQLADFLELDPAQTQRLEQTTSRKAKPNEAYEDLSLDTFQLLSDAYH